MTDKPILFSAAMVRALLEGRKTQTRRVLKPQPTRNLIHQKAITWCGKKDRETFPEDVSYFEHNWSSLPGLRAHTYPKLHQTGDRLWVRESWRADSQLDHIPPRDLSKHEPRLYLADGALIERTCMMIKPGRFRQGMHMPRWASRLTLTVTDVRVQRVQEISYLDTCAEGVDCDTCAAMGQSACYRKGCVASCDAFRTLWDSLNASRGFGWQENPWVAAYTFTVEKRNIDQ